MNHLAFELVASVVVHAAVLDLAPTPDAHVLVLVLVHLVSLVAWFWMKLLFAWDLFMFAVTLICDEDCGGNCFTAETVCGCGCVRSCYLSSPCLERSSGSCPPIFMSVYRISRSAAVLLHT